MTDTLALPDKKKIYIKSKLKTNIPIIIDRRSLIFSIKKSKSVFW